MPTQTQPSSALLKGKNLDSETQEGVRYELIRLLAHGGMGSAYFAHRHTPTGSSPVVVKVMSPHFGDGLVAPELVALKESVALGRLNESVPPTPYVVRYVDSGTALVVDGKQTAWTVLEYVHGGIEGTTLEERVAYAVHRTGYAFDPARAAQALRCIASGLSAIHAASVLHRDLSPGNILCSGLGDGELFKIADFGVARPFGLDRTFQGMKLGTFGYTAPEAGSKNAGFESDVFSLAAVVYFILTGQHYFDAPGPQQVMELVVKGSRPSVRLHTTLSPELAQRAATCARIDELLAQATTRLPRERFRTAAEFAELMLPTLTGAQVDAHSSRRVLSAVLMERARPRGALESQWIEKCRPSEERFIRSTAWDTDGRALALTREGALFWDGNRWRDADALTARLLFPLQAIEKHDGGGWLVLGGTGKLGVIDVDGRVEQLETPDSDLRYCFASGHIDDLLLAIRTSAPAAGSSGFWSSESAELVLFARRKARPAWALPQGLQINTLKRVGERMWLLGGRWQGGGGFAALYEPLEQKFTLLAVPDLRAFIGGASCPEREQGLVAGSEGAILHVSPDGVETSIVPGGADLAAAAVDILGNEWVAGAGVLWTRSTAREPFRPAWVNQRWSTPFISLMAEPGRVIGMTCDGAVLEGLFEFGGGSD
jgi:eukaryotic-like serine/threonine-protein kinase